MKCAVHCSLFLRALAQVNQFCSLVNFCAVQKYNFDPQSLQNTSPENILTLPSLVGLRLFLRSSLTISKVPLSMIAGCVFSKIFHSSSGLITLALFLKDFFVKRKLTVSLHFGSRAYFSPFYLYQRLNYTIS